MGSSFLGKAYGQIGSGLPIVISLLAIVMGLNLLEVIRLQLPSVDIDVKKFSAPPILQVRQTLTIISYSTDDILCHRISAQSQRSFPKNTDAQPQLRKKLRALMRTTKRGTSKGRRTLQYVSLDCLLYLFIRFHFLPGLQAYLAGLTFALVASPCSTPVLATLLAYVSSTKDPVAGGSLLLTYTTG